MRKLVTTLAATILLITTLVVAATAVLFTLLLEGDRDRTDWGASTVAFEEIPSFLLPVYMDTARTCAGLPWQIVAGIGWVETRHGTYNGTPTPSTIDPLTGDVTPPIYGIPLNGTRNTQAIRDTDRGVLDGDTTWDRAVGPMQFIPTTWKTFASHGPGRPVDRDPDPQNAFDSIATTSRFLCPAVNKPVEDLIRRYNNSARYVADVLEKAYEYGLGQDGRDSDPFTIDGEVLPGDPTPVVVAALAQVGKPYVWAQPAERDLTDPDPDSFDCSGLVAWAYRQVGIKLPHFTDALIKLGRYVDPDKEAIEPGDLIFVRGGIPTRDGGHVGIAIGDRRWVNAKGRKFGVVTGPLPERIVAVRRIFSERSDSHDWDDSVPQGPVGPADSETRKVTDREGFRWDVSRVHTTPAARTSALVLASSFDRIVATPQAFRAHVLKMRQTNKRLALLTWLDPTTATNPATASGPTNSPNPTSSAIDPASAAFSPGDLAPTAPFNPQNQSAPTGQFNPLDPSAPAKVAALCRRSIAASGYDGCFLNLPLKPPIPCPSDRSLTVIIVVPPPTFAPTTTTRPPKPHGPGDTGAGTGDPTNPPDPIDPTDPETDDSTPPPVSTVPPPPTTIDPPDCVKQAVWDQALSVIVRAAKGTGEGDNPDGDPLIIQNTNNPLHRTLTL